MGCTQTLKNSSCVVGVKLISIPWILRVESSPSDLPWFTNGHKCQPFFVDLTSIFASFRVFQRFSLFYYVLLIISFHRKESLGMSIAEESERLWVFRQFLAVPFGYVWKHNGDPGYLKMTISRDFKRRNDESMDLFVSYVHTNQFLSFCGYENPHPLMVGLMPVRGLTSTWWMLGSDILKNVPRVSASNVPGWYGTITWQKKHKPPSSWPIWKLKCDILWPSLSWCRYSRAMLIKIFSNLYWTILII